MSWEADPDTLTLRHVKVLNVNDKILIGMIQKSLKLKVQHRKTKYSTVCF